MPELPEVETVRPRPGARARRPALRAVEQRRPDLRFPLPARFAARLEGRKVERLERRAKYHPGAPGQWRGADHASRHDGPLHDRDARQRRRAGSSASSPTRTGADPTHDHVVFTMAGGATITYNDARRFGYMTLLPEAELAEHPHFKGLGVEPLGNELNADYLAREGVRQEDGPQGVPDGPAHRRRPRQHLCLRGAVARRPDPGPLRRARSPRAAASRRRRRRAPGHCHPRPCWTTPSPRAAPPCATTSRRTDRWATSSIASPSMAAKESLA